MPNLAHETGQHLGIFFRLFNTWQMSRPADQMELAPLDQIGGLSHQIRRGRAVFGACDCQGGQSQVGGGGVKIVLRDLPGLAVEPEGVIAGKEIACA